MMIRGFRLDTVKNEINVLISHMLVIAKEKTKRKRKKERKSKWLFSTE